MTGRQPQPTDDDRPAAPTSEPGRWSRPTLGRRGRRIALLLALAFAVAWAAVAVVNVVKPLPPGLAFDGRPIALAGDRIRFLADLSYRDRAAAPVHEQQVFDALLAAIDGAEHQLLLDMFLFNPHLGAGGAVLRPLSAELTTALIDARARRPALAVTFVTDPINDVYGGDPAPHLARLAAAGVDVVRTDLDRLRDSNPGWSAAWRLLARWWGNAATGGWLPHPLDAHGPRVTLRTWLTLLNFKANHRKTVVADDGAGGWRVLVTSLNPHDGSSAHSNVALEVRDARLGREVLAAESAVVAFSRAGPAVTPETPPAATAPAADGADHTVRYLTEHAIRDALLAALAAAEPGDEVDVAVFYLSHRGVLHGLADAARRGARVRLVLDPNRDAFGHAKSGIPNRQSARWLTAAAADAITVRWYATHGEQFHPKLLLVRGAARSRLLLGSANFTRRNLDDCNLEADLEVTMPRGAALDRAVAAWFERLWSNRDGLFTVAYDEYRDDSHLRRIIAWWQEHTGMGTF